MSPSTGQSDSTRLGESLSGTVSSIAAVSAGAVTPVRAAGFYAAITLPLVYLPLLLDGIGPVVGALLAANALALVVGHGHGSD